MGPIRVGFIGLGIDVGIGKPGAWGASVSRRPSPNLALKATRHLETVSDKIFIDALAIIACITSLPNSGCSEFKHRVGPSFDQCSQARHVSQSLWQPKRYCQWSRCRSCSGFCKCWSALQVYNIHPKMICDMQQLIVLLNRLIKPALEAEKMVFVEWPLAANIAQVEELVELANSKKLKTMVGVQAQGDPLVAKIKQLVCVIRSG